MRKKDERGVALILVLLVIALLVPLVLQFDAEARREMREAAAFRDGLKAAALAKSGVQAARGVLKLDARLEAQSGQQFDGLTDPWAMPLTNYQLGDGVITAQIEDERGKLNLNDLAGQGDPLIKQAKVLRVKRLFELIQVDPRLADAVADWVDSNEQPEPNGAESAYYQSLVPPYRAANGPLQTLDELHLVKGFTDDIVRRVSRYVTVYPTVADGAINLNTADPLVLQSLDMRITPVIAMQIQQTRPFRSLADMDKVTGFEPIARELRTTGLFTIKSDHFSGRITATVGEATKIGRAVLRRSGASGDSTLVYFRIE
jgi:general secretion pathway protein K